MSISGFKSLRQVCGKPWRMLSFPQSMIIMQVCIMESGRDILAAMFPLEGSWEEDLNEGDIYDYLDETIGNSNCLAADM